MSRLVVVVPTVRPECHAEFVAAWDPVFRYHGAVLVTVWDGDRPRVTVDGVDAGGVEDLVPAEHRDLFFFRSDCCRNLGFYYAARHLDPGVVVTFDDDVRPIPGQDVVAAHLAALAGRAPLSWMNTGCGEPYYRGVPYGVRAEAPVHLSHGVWTGVPDLDAPTQLPLELVGRVDPDPPFWVGAVPRGVLFPLCGMNVAVTRAALPLLYYAPQGPGTPFDRFADIWMGVALKREFDARGWAVYTGAARVRHARASDVFKNLRQEAEGLRANEAWWRDGDGCHPYFAAYADRRARYAALVENLLGGS